MRTLGFALLLGALFLAFAPEAHARSLAIESLDVDIRIGADGSIHVEERIRVRFEGSWNGIFRNIPYGYRYPTGVRGTIDLSVESIRDAGGQALEYWEKRRQGEVKLKIRVPGAHDATRVVVITYAARNAMRQYSEDDDPEFGAHDQLYWDVVGHSWEMPIQKATATVHLPPSAAELDPKTIHMRVLTGSYGATLSDASARVEQGRVLFETSRALPAYHGMTIVVGFPTGHITYPGLATKALWFALANWFLLIPLGLILAWFLFWWKRGRDALGRRTIIPEFEPPLGLRPAEVGVLLDDRLDRRDVTAGIVDLAVKGVLTISDKDDERRLILHRERLPGADLSGFQRKLVSGIFGDAKHDVAMADLKYEFHKNLEGLRASVLDHLVRRKFFPRRPDKVVSGWMGATTATLLGSVALGWVLKFPLPYWLGLGIAAVVMFLIVPHMPRRTKRGLDALARVKGLQEYMVTAERDRMKDLPMEAFERLLPYAIAFGIHDRWIGAFADLFERPPDWYETDAKVWTARDFGRRIDYFDRSVTRNMYSGPRPVRTSSSGGWGGGWSGGSGFSSGGGFSGGGFGGGGGGGW
jgi:Predicted membrane protein (DUF2207) C-terminal domain/Predicted membrane protein (DUF2207) N-terminal domain